MFEKKNLQVFKKKYIKKKKKMLMLARPLLITKGKKNYIYMEKPTVKENFIKKKKKTTIIKCSLAHEEERSNGTIL
jgi:hypothetical protein